MVGAPQVDPGGGCLIAGHVWDTLGVLSAGWRGALMLRGGNALDVGPRPNCIGEDLGTIADQIVKRYSALADASRPTT